MVYVAVGIAVGRHSLEAPLLGSVYPGAKRGVMMSRKTYFLATALSLVFLCFGAIALLAWSLAKHAGAVSDAAGSVIATLTMLVGVAIVLGLAFMHDSRRSARLPRIENLRIAGKYSGKPAAMGTTPLDLRF
jgi:hypothetical protein